MDPLLGDSAPSCPPPRSSPGSPDPGPSPCWSLEVPCLKTFFPRAWPQRMMPATSPTVSDPPWHEADPRAPQAQTRSGLTLFFRCRPGPLREPHQSPAGASAPGPGTPAPTAGPTSRPGGPCPIAPSTPAPSAAQSSCLQVRPSQPPQAVPLNPPSLFPGLGVPREAAPSQARRPGHRGLHPQA